MKLTQFQSLLDAHRDKQFQLVLPGQIPVPMSFHITEVGHVQKTFIDCGGKIHSTQTCQLQAWVGDDTDHRLPAGKMADVLCLARPILPEGVDLDVEIEYEDIALSQYPIAGASVSENAVTFTLKSKHTDCLAKEICLLPMAACGPSCCC